MPHASAATALPCSPAWWRSGMVSVESPSGRRTHDATRDRAPLRPWTDRCGQQPLPKPIAHGVLERCMEASLVSFLIAPVRTILNTSALRQETNPMTTQEPISPELQTRIDALPDENLRANITRRLNRPWKRTKSNEQIFDEMVAHHDEVLAERAKWRQWSDAEVLAFIQYFKSASPEDYEEFARQERDHNEIDADLWWRVGRLADTWTPGLTFTDNGNLLGHVRDHLQTSLQADQGHGS
jgi:hypothetical protein